MTGIKLAAFFEEISEEFFKILVIGESYGSPL